MKKMVGLILASLVLLGCTQLPNGTQIPSLWDVLSGKSLNTTALIQVASPTPFTFPTANPGTPTPVVLPARSKTLIYQLTGYENNLATLEQTPSDYLVVDAMRQTPDMFFNRDEVAALKEKHATVLAYVSIGEAEDYRYYFNESWKQDPPAWMGKTNPDWVGNIKVRYWDPAWQKIVLEYVRQVAEAGFDGAYLDIVDGYGYWSYPENGENESLQTEDAALKMIAFIQSIRKEAQKINPKFKIYPQNAPELVVYPGYLESIDGIGKETTWFQGYNEMTQPATKASAQDPQIRDSDLGYLRQIHEAGKAVLATDYFDPSQKNEVKDFFLQADTEEFIPYAADHVALDHISSFYETNRVQNTPVNENACEYSGGYCAAEYCPPCPTAEDGGPGTCAPCGIQCPAGFERNYENDAACPVKTSYAVGCCVAKKENQELPGFAEATQACLKLCRDKKPTTDYVSGPCLSNEIIPDWVCDVAHEPRQPVDDEKENTCNAFGQSAQHFVEVDEECQVIHAA